MPNDTRIMRNRKRSSQATTPLKPRRSHRKSRNGCAECRRRHIRCDKNPPVCFNCKTGDRACVYPAGANLDVVSGDVPKVDAQVAQRRPSLLDNRARIPQSLHATEADAFSATDLVVFHHAQTAMADVGLGHNCQFTKVLALGLRHRCRAPYFLDQILALACMHLAVSIDQYTGDTQGMTIYDGMTEESLRHHATARQTRAVASFNEHISEQVDLEIDGARFLFAGILSLQSLAETLSALRSDGLNFSSFIDGMVATFSLQGGMHVATGQPVDDFLPQSRDLRNIMEFLEMSDDDGWRTNVHGGECQPLLDLFEGSDLGETSLDACRGAVHSLQQAFDICQGLSVQDGPHAASAFALKLPPDYSEALRRCVPEALIVLAYYGVLLHRCRQCWIFGDAGARMVRAIAEHVGAYWRDAMRWPLQEIGEA